MITSTNTTELTKALLKFRDAVPTIEKDAENPFFKSSYASLSNILDTIRQSLSEAKLTFVQFPEGDNGLTTRLMHESGEFMEATVTMTPKDQTPQALGSAITYARRYALGAILGLNTAEDDDGNAASTASIHRTFAKAQTTVPAVKAPQQAKTPLQANLDTIASISTSAKLEAYKSKIMAAMGASASEETIGALMDAIKSRSEYLVEVGK